MTIELQIPESNLKGFSDQEKNRLKEATSDYASDLIEETNRIEAGRNPTEGPPEVTRGMVSDATVLLRRGLGAPKKRWELRVLRIVAAVLSLMVGIMYDETKLQNREYMMIFIFVITGAIFAVTISILKE